MADPPWDIHMELPYGTMSDDEMRSLNIPTLQDDGYIFLWVTGRFVNLNPLFIVLTFDIQSWLVNNDFELTFCYIGT